MLCTDCEFRAENWKIMREHYRHYHTSIKRPDKLFTKAARDNVVGEPCGCNKKHYLPRGNK